MSGKELNKIKKDLKEFEKKVTKTKESSQGFLKEMGVLTAKGNVAKRYQGVLCTPEDRD